MKHIRLLFLPALIAGVLAGQAHAGQVSRLTPPSELFASGHPAPVIARFLPGQKFDLQATVQPDPGTTVASFVFYVNGQLTAREGYMLPGDIPMPPVNVEKTSLVREKDDAGCIDPGNGRTTGASGCVLRAGLPGNTAVVSQRGYSYARPGVHTFKVVARQSDGKRIEATGNFEIVAIDGGVGEVKNVVILFGDGMGAAHRTAARIVSRGYAQGKAKGLLAMDTFSNSAQVMTASLNSIVTDSAPGMQNYVTGNKVNNNEEGVFPDDTLDAFDNPRIEYLSEYLHALGGKSLGIVTTADVFDATPASNAIHTSSRGNGTGIVDQYLDDRHLHGLKVLMGGGRKWFLPNLSNSVSPQPANGSQRRSANDYVLPQDVINGWNASPGRLDPERDLIADFQAAGFSYAANKSDLDGIVGGRVPDALLGLFSYSNMNVAYDKIAGRRGHSEVVDAYGFPDQPLLEEMTDAALKVLSKNPNGFVLMVEAASIDKQAHLMDSERWTWDVLELDRATQVALDFAEKNPGTLLIVTADHECSGAAIIGAATVSAAELNARPDAGQGVVGVYEAAGFPEYDIAEDGYPVTTHIDNKLLIGYGGNANRYETWNTYAYPTHDSQQPFSPPQSPANPSVRNQGQGFLITGHVAGNQAVHTATDIPLSAHGFGASLFNGVIDNTDVFFKIGQLAVGGVPQAD